MRDWEILFRLLKVLLHLLCLLIQILRNLINVRLPLIQATDLGCAYGHLILLCAITYELDALIGDVLVQHINGLDDLLSLWHPVLCTLDSVHLAAEAFSIPIQLRKILLSIFRVVRTHLAAPVVLVAFLLLTVPLVELLVFNAHVFRLQHPIWGASSVLTCSVNGRLALGLQVCLEVSGRCS